MIKIGEKVPEFFADIAIGQECTQFSFSHAMDRPLVLFFYPRDNTSGCTEENQDFRNNYPKFIKKGVTLMGISRDTIKSHIKFSEKLQLPFPLIADPTEEICTLFNVMRDKNMYGKKVRGIERSTFIISAQGVLEKEWRKVKIPGHVAEVLQAIENEER